MGDEGDRPAGTLRLAAVFIGTTYLLGLTYVYGLLFFRGPTYFSFNDLATSSVHDLHLTGAIIRLLLPITVGFSLARFSSGLPIQEATLSGFLASLLLSWPAVYFPDLRQYLVSDSLANDPVKLLTVYALFILLYSVLARIGAIAGVYYGKSPRFSISSMLQKVSLWDIGITIGTGLVTNVIWEILIRRWK